MNKRNLKKYKQRLLMNKFAIIDSFLLENIFYERSQKSYIYILIKNKSHKITKINKNKIECKEVPETLNNVLEFTGSDEESSIIVIPARLSKEIAFLKIIPFVDEDWDLDIRELRKSDIGLKNVDSFNDIEFIITRKLEEKYFSHKAWTYEL